MLRRIGLLAAVALAFVAGSPGARPLVALVDSGVDHSHPALRGRITGGWDFVDGDSIADDRLGHGTGLAGVLVAAGAAAGPAHECSILPLKVVGGPREYARDGVDATNVARAIRYALAHGADLILVGAGFAGPDAEIAGAVAAAAARGVPVIAPAGNAGAPGVLYPAALPTVLAVAAIEDGPRPGRVVYGSGVEPRTLAPGGGPVPRSGSSIAAARVAALAAGALARGAALPPELARTASPPSAPAVGASASLASFAGGGDAGPGRLQYADRAGTDIVMDAPWRTVRDYVPVLFFFPQFEGGRRVERIRIFEYASGAVAGPPVFVDSRAGPDSLNGATIVGPLAESRDGLAEGEAVRNFWHYVVRVPHANLRHHGTPDVHELYAEVEWTRPALLWRQRMRNHRVLRVLAAPGQFPGFDAADRYLDTHVHTIAEQSTGPVLDADGAHKAYCGPIVMLLEVSYALGLVQTQPRDGNWSAYRDSVVVTDHNVFYSTAPFESGALPGYGPTAGLANGHAAEAGWYRENLGRLAGEEITLRRGPNQDYSFAPNLGHHLLAYGTPHFEGPWHGGLFATSRLENPNTPLSVLAGAKAAGGPGFFYAAHPNLEGFVWPPEYFAQAIGFAPHDSRSGPQVDSASGEFLFKGSEVWNIKQDRAAARSGRLAASSAFDAMNPFEGGPESQRFAPVAWDAELGRSLDTLFTQIGRGLRFAFRESPADRFIRKLYLSAGSDAHGDFNYTDEVTATMLPWSGWLTSNAYARVRTYALAHDRPAGSRDAVSAFRHGNTLVTDGPVFEYHLDADGRHDPGAGPGRWHDATVCWENAEGAIGGDGRFDGGRTMLVPLPGEAVRMRGRWLASASPGAAEIARYKFDRIAESARDSFEVAAGPAAAEEDRGLPVPMDRLAALVASVRDPGVDERCIANPVWVVPVRIEVHGTPAGDSPGSHVAYAPGALRVAFHFPVSMSDAPGTRAFLRPLDARGNSTDPEIELRPLPGWEAEDGVTSARYTVTNAASIAWPSGDWDAGVHRGVPGARSFVVYLRGPADVNGNVLNDVGRAFVLGRSERAR